MKQGRFKNILKIRFSPFLIIVLGIFISFLLWISLLNEKTHSHFIYSLHLALPWIALVGGVLISFLLAALLYLIKMGKERVRSHAALDAKFKQEIAERIHAEETKQHLEKALLQGQKLQAIGTLAGGIAHDFNNILYAIMGYTTMSREDIDKTSITYENLGSVLKACHRGQELVARILAFGRKQQHELHPIPVKSTIESALALLKPTIPASVTIVLTSPIDELIILGNQTLLHQVIVNLINNAVDAMDGEGKIAIELDRIENKSLSQLPKLLSPHYCQIKLKDTGHGMDQTTLERIFEPFFTTKEVGKGTGLGLSTVHAIIEEHQGDIQVTSQLGRGTTFTILLPEYHDGQNITG